MVAPAMTGADELIANSYRGIEPKTMRDEIGHAGVKHYKVVINNIE